MGDENSRSAAVNLTQSQSKDIVRSGERRTPLIGGIAQLHRGRSTTPLSGSAVVM